MVRDRCRHAGSRRDRGCRWWPIPCGCEAGGEGAHAADRGGGDGAGCHTAGLCAAGVTHRDASIARCAGGLRCRRSWRFGDRQGRRGLHHPPREHRPETTVHPSRCRAPRARDADRVPYDGAPPFDARCFPGRSPTPSAHGKRRCRSGRYTAGCANRTLAARGIWCCCVPARSENPTWWTGTVVVPVRERRGSGSR